MKPMETAPKDRHILLKSKLGWCEGRYYEDVGVFWYNFGCDECYNCGDPLGWEELPN